MKKNIGYYLLAIFLLAACDKEIDWMVTPSNSDLQFNALPTVWDEAIPLGNAMVGALVWQKDSCLRFSLDRVDLWDLRPTDSLSGINYRFAWVKDQVRKKDYRPVQLKFDVPYDRSPAPAKIPGAALEFRLKGSGKPSGVYLYIKNALCEVHWENGMELKTFVHPTEPIGWFVFEHVSDSIIPVIIAPAYAEGNESVGSNPVDGQDLLRLGYASGKITEKPGWIHYHQKGWKDFTYDVNLRWEHRGDRLFGVWSVTSSLMNEQATEKTLEAMDRGVETDYKEHLDFWTRYWAASSVVLPDTLLQKQYDNEMYKFGSVTREKSYPISLQAVWTADNGKLPPWKGDYHHDLNTQLSYWPAYTGNHLREGMGYLNTLWNQRETYKQYTRQYFETEGMNVPGVCTLTGQPMGGWIQYAMSQTVGAWLAHHFYMHWKYSADSVFLKTRAYPWLKDVATYLEQQSSIDSSGMRHLEISSSPEIFDNSIQAWFKTMTNYDLSLMRFAFAAAAEMAKELGRTEEMKHWKQRLAELPDYDKDVDGALTFAKGFPYEHSHRHFSHALAFHPLGVLDVSHGVDERKTIEATLNKIEVYGSDYWTGYTYAWFANMKARVFDGEGAACALRIFAECFCLSNTFHVNGDQSGTGKSKYTYRPFTLEGNFAFASAIQEMLLQSHTGVIRVFPAVPADWKNVSFANLRTMGAFLVSAKRVEGRLHHIDVFSEKGGTFRLAKPEDCGELSVTGCKGETYEENGILILYMQKGETVKITTR